MNRLENLTAAAGQLHLADCALHNAQEFLALLPADEWRDHHATIKDFGVHTLPSIHSRVLLAIEAEKLRLAGKRRKGKGR